MRKFDGMIDDPVILDERPIDKAILDLDEHAAAFRRSSSDVCNEGYLFILY